MVSERKSRSERERELREMLNDPERRSELVKMYYAITNYAPKLGTSPIRTILDHEYGAEK